ncbi:hypothetical protein AB0J56_48110, partial [Actinoplanes xinjiangensis]
MLHRRVSALVNGLRVIHSAVSALVGGLLDGMRRRRDRIPARKRVIRRGRLPLLRHGGRRAPRIPEPTVRLRLRRDGRIVTRPIKGTRPATAAGRRELLASAKER